MRRTRPTFRLRVRGAPHGVLGGASERTGARRSTTSTSRPSFRLVASRCHGDTNPAGGWSATSFLGDDRVRRALERAGHAPARRPGARSWRRSTRLPTTACSSAAEQATLTAWVAGGTPAYHAGVHDPGIVDPRSTGFHGDPSAQRRAGRRCSTPSDPSACGRCHDGAPARPAGVTPAGAGRALVHRAATTSRAACSRARRATDREREPIRRAIHASSPATSPGRTRRTSSLRPDARRDCPARRVTRCPGRHGHRGPARRRHRGSHVRLRPSSRADPSYDPSTGGCTVSCHAQGGAKPQVTWTAPSTPVGCGDCHGSPPSGHYPGSCTELPRGSQRDRNRAERRTASHERQGRPRRRQRPVRRLPWHRRQPVAQHGGAPRAREPDAYSLPRLLELPCGARRRSSTRSSRRHGDTSRSQDSPRREAPPQPGTATTCTNVACHGANLADPAAVPAWSRPFGRAVQVRRMPRRSAIATHPVHVVRPVRLPRQRSDARWQRRPAHLGERQDSSRRRDHRVRSLRRAPIAGTRGIRCTPGRWAGDRACRGGSFRCRSLGPSAAARATTRGNSSTRRVRRPREAREVRRERGRSCTRAEPRRR